MRREPALTLEGALRILGAGPERRWLTIVDKALGGVILAGGVVALGAAPPVAALGAAVFALVDQKNEAVGLLRSAVGKISELTAGKRPQDRARLVTAAHTTIVIAAFFDAWRELAAPSGSPGELSGEEQEVLASGLRSHGESLYELLFRAEAPAPGAQWGFAENKERVAHWHSQLQARLAGFYSDLSLSYLVDGLVTNDLTDAAAARYDRYFLELAAKVPDFEIWALLNEGAATRELIRRGAPGAALARIEQLLTATLTGLPAPGSQAAVVARHNRAVLDREIFTESSSGLGLTFPRVGDGYINPAYRVAQAGPQTHAADEEWWKERPRRTGLDITVAGHLLTTQAVTRPLVLLGHPGAGKSTLTQVLAARLPADAFTTVRVPLRDVGADAPVYDQVAEALKKSTNGRVEWPRLVEDTAGTLRVLLLDGLDELLHASASNRSGYLKQVMEFQRIEAEQDRPVAVIVTSRTLVADRVDIPAGTPLIKLDAFDDDQIGEWLATWNRVNPGSLDRKAVLAHRGLAEQPLLLLMLAVYATSSDGDVLSADLSPAQLYERLLTRFARREADKVGGDVETAIAGYLDNLSVAALGMFNRGRQDIADVDLGDDLKALETARAGNDVAEAGRRVVGQFFFVHTSQAQEIFARRQRYEFLHATFGEFLIAWRVLKELADVADSAFGGKRERDPDDDLLFALLSHSPIAVRGAIIDFIVGMAATRDDVSDLVRVIDVLITGYRQRDPFGRLQAYRPSGVDGVRRLAAFSANLVLLRAALAGVVPPAFDRDLRSTIQLWRAGLAINEWHATINALDRQGDDIILDAFPSEGAADGYVEFNAARLVGDRVAVARLRYGLAAVDHVWFSSDGDDWRDTMRAWILPALSGPGYGYIWEPPGANVPVNHIVEIGTLLERLITFNSPDRYGFRLKYASMLTSTYPTYPFDVAWLLSVVATDFTDPADLRELEQIRTEQRDVADTLKRLRRLIDGWESRRHSFRTGLSP